jgi:hypothetical protein
VAVLIIGRVCRLAGTPGQSVRAGGRLSRIPSVNCRRCALFALLVYVSLDLSLPGMPGAFVFEPTESVESAQMNRWRAIGDVVPLAAPLPSSFATPPQIDDGDASRPIRHAARSPLDIVSRLPRASLALASPSDDPH